MKISYDPRYNIAYLRRHEMPASVETIHVSDELNGEEREMLLAPPVAVVREKPGKKYGK